MKFQTTFKVLTIFGLLLVSISFTDPIWTVVSVIATLLIGLSLSLKLEELLIVSIPISFDVFVPTTLNINASDFIILPLFLLYLIKYIHQSKKSHLLIRTALLWFGGFTLVLTIPFVFQLSPTGLGVENLSSYFKLTIGFCYLLTAIYIFNFSSYSLRSELAKLWCFVALLVSMISIAAFLLSLLGLTTQFMYVSTRVKGTFENPNTLALYLLVSLGVLIGVWINRPLFRYLAGASTITVAIALANSRAGTIAFIVLVLLIIGLSLFGGGNRQVKKSLSLIFLPVLFFSVVPLGLLIWGLIKEYVPQILHDFSALAPEPEPEPTTGIQEIHSSDLSIGVNTPISSSTPSSVSIEHFSTIREPLDGDLRFSLWDAALRLWKTNPITGVGLGNFPQLSEKYTGVNYVTHNSFLSFLAETGLVGLIFFCIPFAAGIILLFINKKSYISKSLIAVLSTVVVMMSANNFENIRFIWFLLGATLAWAIEKNLSPRAKPGWGGKTN